MAETKLNSSVPNLFDYATSELSQDAFLLWLLNWADPKYKDADEQLNAAAKKFVCLLLGKDIEISSVKCKKQYHRIDVFAIIIDKSECQYALIIEDKTETKEHSKQIKRYRDLVNNKSKYPEPPHCVYYKSGNESMSNLNKLSTDCTIIFRKQILDTLLPFIGKTNNSIFVDYFNHLQKIENLTNSYMTKPVADWGSRAWQGFYMALEGCLNAKLNQNIMEDDKLTLCKWMNDPYKDAWDFKMPKFSINKDDSIKLYLQIDSKNGCLSIRTYCNPKKTQDNGWSELVEKEIYAKSFDNNESFVNKLKKIKLTAVRPERIAESENTTFAYIKNKDNSHFVSGEAIKVDTIADRLLELQSLIEELASTLIKNYQPKQ